MRIALWVFAALLGQCQIVESQPTADWRLESDRSSGVLFHRLSPSEGNSDLILAYVTMCRDRAQNLGLTLNRARPPVGTSRATLRFDGDAPMTVAVTIREGGTLLFDPQAVNALVSRMRRSSRMSLRIESRNLTRESVYNTSRFAQVLARVPSLCASAM